MPQVDEAWLWVWRAFHKLSSDRPWYGGGMSQPVPAGIPWLLLIEYATYHNYNGEQIDLLEKCIRAMDVIFITHHNQKVKESNK